MVLMNRSNSILITGIVITGLASLFALLLGLSFLRIPIGASIRPMSTGVLLASIMFISLVVGLGCLIEGWKEEPRWLRWYILALIFAPYAFFHIALRFAQHVRGFTLAP